MNERFRKFAEWSAWATGSPWAFIMAVSVIIVWLITGPMCHFSDTWQLVINTGTTIVTFLMVFLIQNEQNRDAKAMHLKLDELILAMKGARNNLVNLEQFSDEELQELQKEFERVCARSGRNVKGVAEVADVAVEAAEVGAREGTERGVKQGLEQAVRDVKETAAEPVRH